MRIVEDAPYVYISYADAEDRPRPFVSMDPQQTVHLFTGSKIGFPGPRLSFGAKLLVWDWDEISSQRPATSRSGWKLGAGGFLPLAEHHVDGLD